MNETKIITATKRTIIGSGEIWIEEGEPGKVYVQTFRGSVLEVDLTRFRFKSDEEAAKFIAKLVDQSGYDSLILANLVPVKRQIQMEVKSS